MNEAALEEEKERKKRWVERQLVRSLFKTQTGKEFNGLYHDENEVKKFNASPEYRELHKKLFGNEIEACLGTTVEADEVQEKEEKKKSNKDDNGTEEEEKPVRKPYEWFSRKLSVGSFGWDTEVEEDDYPPDGNVVWEQETSGNKHYTNEGYDIIYYEYNEYNDDGGNPFENLKK